MFVSNRVWILGETPSERKIARIMAVQTCKKLNNHKKIQLSEPTVKRFLGFATSFHYPHKYYHQTLTFPEVISDRAAKDKFNTWMNTVLKNYSKSEVGVIYVGEYGSNGRLHFHVLFFFFDRNNLPYAPSRMERDLRTYLYKKWSDLNGGRLVHDANRLTVHHYTVGSLRYFLKNVHIPRKAPKRAKTNFWGHRKKEVFERHRIRIDTTADKELFNLYFKRRTLRKDQRKAKYSWSPAKQKIISPLYPKRICDFNEQHRYWDASL